MIQMNIPMKQIHRQREQTCNCQVGEDGGGKDWELGISRCKLEYLGWINNKVLLYSTRGYSQYPMTNQNGKVYEKENICVTESLCGTAEITTTL